MNQEKIVTKRSVLKLAFESVLIVFSVLLALFLNEYRGQIKEERQKEIAMQMVEIELEANLKTLRKWLPYHNKIRQDLDDKLQGQAQGITLFNHNGELAKGLMPNGIVQSLLSDTSWHTLKSSSASSLVDLRTMFTLSELYKLQAIGVESTLNNILQVIASREALEKEDQRTTLILLRNGFREIAGQESFLIHKYEQALKQVKSRNKKIEQNSL